MKGKTMKRLFLSTLILFITGIGYAQDPTKVTNIDELYVTFSKAKGGETIALEGEFPHLNLTKRIFPDESPVILDGQGAASISGGLDIMDISNLVVRRLTVYGGVNLTSSYPKEYGLHNITLDHLEILDSPSRGIMLGGSKISGIHILHCKIFRVIGTYNTHMIYLTGAHWEESIYGPVTDVIIRGCEMGINPNGRNGIQLNGRFKGVLIENNEIYLFQQDGIELKGCQDVIIRGNVVYAGNRGTCLGLHDYIWLEYGKPKWTPEVFKQFHHPCQNILVENNTFVVGPKQWCQSPWKKDQPDDHHPTIFVHNFVHKSEQYPEYADIDYPNKNIVIQKNLIWTPNREIIDFAHPQEASATIVMGNMICCAYPGTGLPFITNMKYLKLCQGNFLEDPETVFAEGLPVYPDSIDLGVNPDYDWTEHKIHFNPFSWPAKKAGVGKKFPVVVVGTESGEGR
jgi:hypothetical protein